MTNEITIEAMQCNEIHVQVKLGGGESLTGKVIRGIEVDVAKGFVGWMNERGEEEVTGPRN